MCFMDYVSQWEQWVVVLDRLIGMWRDSQLDMQHYLMFRTQVYIGAITVVFEGSSKEEGEEWEWWMIFRKDVWRYQFFQSIWESSETMSE